MKPQHAWRPRTGRGRAVRRRRERRVQGLLGGAHSAVSDGTDRPFQHDSVWRELPHGGVRWHGDSIRHSGWVCGHHMQRLVGQRRHRSYGQLAVSLTIRGRAGDGHGRIGVGVARVGTGRRRRLSDLCGSIRRDGARPPVRGPHGNSSYHEAAIHPVHLIPGRASACRCPSLRRRTLRGARAGRSLDR